MIYEILRKMIRPLDGASNRWGNYVVVRKPFLFALCLFLSVINAWSSAQDQSADAVKSENFLPASTTFWVSVPDVLTLKTKFDQTDFGRLTHDADMQPFIEAMTDQVREWANAKNVRLGLTVDDIAGLESGEICIAGILPRDAGEGDGIGRGSHGLVFLVDVSGSMDEANELIEKIGAKMKEKGAEKIDVDPVHGADISKWKWEKENVKTGKVREYTTLQTITNGWLIASDNEAIFRDVIRRIKKPVEGVALDTLSAHVPFAKIQLETQVKDVSPHVRWFIDPFGYMKLADAIAEEERVFRQRKDNIGDTLESQGFDAIQGVGGSVSFASDKEKDLVFRVFAYTPPRIVEDAQKRARGILSFKNKWEHELVPESWVAGDCSGYSTFTWDVQSAFKNVGEVFDAFISPDEDGDWDAMINGMSVDMDLDLWEMVSRLDNRFSIMSATELPIDVRSERIAIGVKFGGDVDEFYEMAKKLLPEGDEMVIKGHKMIVIDTTADDDDEGELQIDSGEDDIFSDGDDEDDAGEDEEEIEQFNLFEKRYVTCIPSVGGDDGGYLLVCNNEAYLVDIIEKALKGNASDLIEADDFVVINEVLDSLIDPSLVSVRQFGRMDKIFELNYEMMRDGKMAQSQTVLARVLNQIFKDPNADADAVREQQIDGSKLPDDYNKSVAPFLGPSGYVMETKEDGWRITGVILKKKGRSEVVRKNDEEKSRR